MLKKIFLSLLILIALYSLFIPSATFADIGAGGDCDPKDIANRCIEGYSCQPDPFLAGKYVCQEASIQKIFGIITPPDALKGLVGADPSGAGGLSIFFTNFIALIYSLAALVLVLMLVWGAWDWLTSEGEKEKLQSAQRKIINALIGIMLFAGAFAIIEVFGRFTGFTFFVGQN